MKSLLHKWRKFLILEGLEHYAVGGKIRLYHYSEAKDETLTLDPDYFLSRGSSFTRRDRDVSGQPRIFFYTNLDHAESIVKAGRSLYTAFVDTNKVYDLTKDPEGLLKKSRPYPEINQPDIDKVLRSLADKSQADGPEGIRDEEGQLYFGVFYRVGGVDMVNLFEPIEVHKFNPEDVKSPLDDTGDV